MLRSAPLLGGVVRCLSGVDITLMGPGSAVHREGRCTASGTRCYFANRATSSTCGVWRNWSTGVTLSMA
jgi:hypothetical protein